MLDATRADAIAEVLPSRLSILALGDQRNPF
jgi:hypothetical protein